MPEHIARYVRLVGATSPQLRTAKFEQREHIIVPVTMLVEGVLWASNSDQPELVLFDEFSKTPDDWNGRPAVGSHPTLSGVPVSANLPEVMESERFGMVFNTTANDKKRALVCEGWLDPSRVRAGSVAERVLKRLENGEPVEVSVGASIIREMTAGSWKGQSYGAIWREIRSDHLAFLDEDEIGACSIEMGCGALRAAARSVNIITATGVVHGTHLAGSGEVAVAAANDDKRSLRERFMALLPFRDNVFELREAAKKDVTDRELRMKLENAFRASIPGFMFVDSVQPFANSAVALAMPEDEMLMLQQSYTLDADGNVTLTGEAQQVQEVRKFEPVAAEGQPPTTVDNVPQPAVASGKCGCAKPGEAHMKTKAQRVQALIDAKKFDVADKPHLEALSDAALETIEKANGVPQEQPAPTPQPVTQPSPGGNQTPTPEQPAPANAAAKPLTEDEYLAQAPASIRQALRDMAETSRATRQRGIAALKATGRCTIPDADLETMALPTLQHLMTLAAVPAESVSYLGQPVAVNAHNFSDEGIPEPVGIIRHMAENKRVQ